MAAGDRVYVAAADAHTVHAIDAKSGKPLWQYVGGARIDSPPTIYGGTVIFAHRLERIPSTTTFSYAQFTVDVICISVVVASGGSSGTWASCCSASVPP